MKKTLLFLFFTSLFIFPSISPNQLFAVCSSSVDMGGHDILNIKQLKASSAVINDGKSVATTDKTKVIIGNPSTKSCIYFKTDAMICSEPNSGLAFYGKATGGVPAILATSAKKFVINSSDKDLGGNNASAAVEGCLTTKSLQVFNDTTISDKSKNLYINGGWGHNGMETNNIGYGAIYASILKMGGSSTTPVFYYDEIQTVTGVDTCYPNGGTGVDNAVYGSSAPTSPSPNVRLNINGTIKFANAANKGWAQAGQSCTNDIAEVFPTSDFTIKKGDIVALDSSNKKFIKKASKQRAGKIIGVVATNPAVLFEGDKTRFNPSEIFEDKRSVPVTLAGRVPVNISLEGGPIKIGDPITISSFLGVGKKAEKSGMVVGVALENYFHKKSSDDQIMIFINTNWQPSEKDFKTFLTLRKKRDSLKVKNQILKERINVLKVALAQKIHQ